MRKRARKKFFFEKKNQKTFAYWPSGVSAARAQFMKFFLLLFCSQKRSSFFLGNGYAAQAAEAA
jgi:hypothetical protein